MGVPGEDFGGKLFKIASHFSNFLLVRQRTISRLGVKRVLIFGELPFSSISVWKTSKFE